MITGTLAQAQVCAFLGAVPVLRRALAWIRALPADAPDGITELEGPECYVNVHGYPTKAREACGWESHRHTVDLQFCRAGGELVDWTPALPVAGSMSYDGARDFELWPETIRIEETLRLEAGRFVLFLPGELHRPMISDGQHADIRKLVVKIPSRLLPQA